MCHLYDKYPNDRVISTIVDDRVELRIPCLFKQTSTTYTRYTSNALTSRRETADFNN